MKKQLLFSLSAAAPIILFLLFAILKICNLINWSWWLVTAPIWIPLGIVLVLGILIGSILLWWQYKYPDEYDKLNARPDDNE